MKSAVNKPMSDRLASRNNNRILVNLHNRASLHPDKIAYTFLENGQKPSASLV
ncbi:hypothetical protein [Nostoc sp. C052]|uniref:hypothetical protein n=1 Tax=Nostoc sp. C052 TaxID=2576902 RepID=UPI00277B577E|nr:hypothetical protein [Nostoc sp. C052]